MLGWPYHWNTPLNPLWEYPRSYCQQEGHDSPHENSGEFQSNSEKQGYHRSSQGYYNMIYDGNLLGMWTSLLTGSAAPNSTFHPKVICVWGVCMGVCSLWKQKSVEADFPMRFSGASEPSRPLLHPTHREPSAPNIPEHLQPNQSQWPDTGFLTESHQVVLNTKNLTSYIKMPSRDLKSLGKNHLLKAISCFWDLRSFPFDSFCTDDWNIYLFVQPILSGPIPLGPAWKTLMWSSFLIWIWAFRKTGLVPRNPVKTTPRFWNFQDENGKSWQGLMSSLLWNLFWTKKWQMMADKFMMIWEGQEVFLTSPNKKHQKRPCFINSESSFAALAPIATASSPSAGL